MKGFKLKGFQKVFGFSEQVQNARKEFVQKEKRMASGYQVGIALAGSVRKV